MIGLDKARELILAAARPLPSEEVSLGDALGRVVAEDVVADADVVPYPRSAMDGYALHAVEAEGATPDHPLTLRVVGAVFAEQSEAILAPRTAMAITTGAPMPQGADAVVPHEEVERADRAIVISAPVAAGSCVFPPGEDARRGEVLVRRHDIIQPATLGLLAFIGRARLEVHRRPRVSFVCTGNELVDVTATPGRGQIRNSNAFTFSAMIAGCGAEAKFCGVAPDDREALGRVLRSAREGSDMLITTGGASVGARDLVKGALEDLGVDFRFRSIAVRPGKPMGFGTWDGLPVCVLPGNPAAAFVCFQELVRPALLRLAGRDNTRLPVVRAELRGHAKSKAERRYIMLARLALTAKGFEVAPLANQCSALVRTSADANALIVFPEGPASFDTGDAVEVHVLDWTSVVEVSQEASVRSEPEKRTLVPHAAPQFRRR